MCLSLKDFYEKYCFSRINPTLNLIEMQLKRELYGMIQD
jgi:hypothetical protein